MNRGARWIGVAVLVAVTAAGADPAAATTGADLDSTFGDSGKVVVDPPPGGGERPAAQVILPDGKILVAGTGFPARGGSVFMALRFGPDGSLDQTFGDRGRVWTDLATVSAPSGGRVHDGIAVGVSGASALAVAPDGRFVLGGYTGTLATAEAALVRYRPDGTLDPSFGADGVVVTDFGGLGSDVVSALTLMPGGRIVATGSSGDRMALARYHPGGGLDTSFGPEGVVLSGGMLNGLSAAVDADGRLLVAGQSGRPGGPFDLAVARYHRDGVPDASFGTGGFARTDLGASGEFPRALLLEPDGGLLVAGTSGAGFVLLRHLADGRRDPGFGTGGVVTSGPSVGWARSIERLPDRRIVVAGALLAEPPLGRDSAEREVAVCRYLADGTLDGSFGTDGIVGTDLVASRHDDGVAASLHPDGRLTITATSFDAENTHPYVVLVRYGDVVT